jgi:hypothetical protein
VCLVLGLFLALGSVFKTAPARPSNSPVETEGWGLSDLGSIVRLVNIHGTIQFVFLVALRTESGHSRRHVFSPNGPLMLRTLYTRSNSNPPLLPELPVDYGMFTIKIVSDDSPDGI